MKIKTFCWMLVFCFLFSSRAFSAPEFFKEVQRYDWADKLKRGAVNIVTSPVEVARQIQITSEENSMLSGWTIGLVSGLSSGLLRLGAGVIDLVTFPFNFPDSRKAPLLDPEYVWEKPGVNYA